MTDIKKIISEMTLEEKASLCSGDGAWHTKAVERLGVPAIMMADGPHGLRKQDVDAENTGIHESIPATCFPSAAGLACSWDKELIEKVGRALGEACQAEGVSIILGPAANIKRSPLCGRNFEYFSEDPYLSSKIASSHIKGVQSQGVGTSLKHFAANNQEHRRMSVNTVIDERVLREIYLASFEDAVKNSQPWTVMCAYNKINGSYCSENKYLLTDILKDEWGHEGFVMSDWGAVNKRADGIEAGLELEMPGSNGVRDKEIIAAVKDGRLNEKVLDKAVERLLNIIFKALENKKENMTYDKEAQHQLAREVSKECTVLLKNEDNILPLKKEGKFAIIGAFAKSPRYQGEGSSHINPLILDDICDEVKKAAGSAEILFEEGYRLDSDEVDEMLIERAKKAALESDGALIFAGLPDRYESEGYDREHMRIPENHDKLIEEVLKVQKNVIIILSNGSPVEMPWIDNVKGLLEVYLGGQALGGAVAGILFGDANPCGKLAETFPKELSHNPSYLNFPGEGDKVEYKEGLFVGYRYYDKKKIEPLFPFGYGLSYTSFEYTNILIDRRYISDEDSVIVSVKVKNTGKMSGKEIVQLYVRDVESSVIRPEKELKGFEKVELMPEEEKTVKFTLNERSFAYYNVELKDWHVESGEFEILIGKSSKEIVLSEKIVIKSSVKIKKKVHRNTIIGDLMEDPLRKKAADEIINILSKEGGMLSGLKDAPDMMMAVARYLPIHAAVGFSCGEFNEDMLNNMIKILNE